MTETHEIPCCKPGCSETVSPKRAALFPPRQAPCLSCGETAAKQAIALKARSIVTMHKSGSTYVPPTPAGRQFVRDVAAMRRGEGGQ